MLLLGFSYLSHSEFRLIQMIEIVLPPYLHSLSIDRSVTLSDY